MKQLELNNSYHHQLVISFGEWLKAGGYSEQTVYNLPNHVKEFLWWCEQQNHLIERISKSVIHDYYQYLSNRPHARKAGALSINQIKKHRQALVKLSEYLLKTRAMQLPLFQIEQQATATVVSFLTEKDMLKLYDSTDNDKYGRRDRAMLAILYGCGLRRNEAYMLNMEDIQQANRILHVKHGKGKKERLVPMVGKCYQDIEEYIISSRPQLTIKSSNALLLSERGSRLSGQAMQLRLNRLCARAGMKAIGLHALRHSIATHLLSHGMSLERVADFLGHSSIESTQIYTHLIQEHE